MRARASRFFVFVVLLFALVVRSTPASAAAHVVVRAASKPLVLAARDGGYAAEFTIENTGDAPLVVSRIAVLGDEDDPRSPSRITVRFNEGAPTSATIAPGGSKTAVVRWMPERDPRMKQALGHVVITSTDETSGIVAIGFRARVPTALAFVADHLLSWMFFLPLVGVVLAFALRVAGGPTDRAMRAVAITTFTLELALAAWVLARFHPDVTLADGNDGFQLVDRAAWIRPLGIEYFVGVDGMSITLVVLIAVVAFAVALASSSDDRRGGGYYALLLLLVSGAIGVVVSLDLVLVFASWELTLVALFLLVAMSGESARRGTVATKLAMFGLASSAAIGIAFALLYANGDRTFLVDGTSALRTSSIPELARVAFTTKHAMIAGVPIARIAWVLLFVGFGVALPMFPFHTWLPDATSEAPAPIGALIGGAIVPLAPYALLRSGLMILPETTRWGASALVSFGVVTVVYGALCALAQRDLRRIIAYASMSHMGLCFVGLGALTPQGFAGALVVMTTQGAATALAFILCGALEERTGSRDVTAFGGLARETPLWSTLVAIALFAAMGLPGLAGFWGALTVLVGAFASWPVHAAIAILGGVISAAAVAITLQRLCFGAANPAWKASVQLEAFGGKVPDLNRRELACVALIVVALVVLGVWPVPLFAAIASGVRDIAARLSPAGPDPLSMIDVAATLAALVRPT